MTASMPDSLLQAAARTRTMELLDVFEGSIHFLLNAWDDLCKETLRSGDAEPLQAIRNECERHFSQSLTSIDVSLQAIGTHSDPESLRSRTRLMALRDQLATKYTELFPKWQTLDDLEEILLAHITIPNEKLIAWAKQNPSSQEWYNASDDAFPTRE